MGLVLVIFSAFLVGIDLDWPHRIGLLAVVFIAILWRARLFDSVEDLIYGDAFERVGLRPRPGRARTLKAVLTKLEQDVKFVSGRPAASDEVENIVHTRSPVERTGAKSGTRDRLKHLHETLSISLSQIRAMLNGWNGRHR